jgi:hypothetical protein
VRSRRLRAAVRVARGAGRPLPHRAPPQVRHVQPGITPIRLAHACFFLCFLNIKVASAFITPLCTYSLCYALRRLLKIFYS